MSVSGVCSYGRWVGTSVKDMVPAPWSVRGRYLFTHQGESVSGVCSYGR